MSNFSFWCPLEISKARIDEKTGEELMLLGGIASTADEDSDGEFLDPKGFDIKPLLKSGLVNWHHQAKNCPSTIVGEPIKAEIRKEGLYIETKLYPSSQVARDIWALAKTLDADSTTRRLGYSIEGKVLERKSNDQSSPDFKKIVKAIITGVAITHMPKNPKTFANIIKGEIDEIEIDEVEENDAEEKQRKEDEYYEQVGIKQKGDDAAGGNTMTTDSARATIKEDLDHDIKVQTFGKAEVFEKLFQDIPGISIKKAKQIYSLIQNISIMAKRQTITEEDISKAYDALGLDEPNLFKGDDAEEVDDVDTDEVDDTEEEDEEDVKKGNDAEDEEPDAEADDYDEDADDDEDVQKGVMYERFDRIEKALAVSHLNTTKYIKALGVMHKAQSDELEKAIKALNIANEKIDELTELNKAQSDEISSLTSRIEEFGNMPMTPKSVRSVAAVERNFNKGQEDELNKGTQLAEDEVSIFNKAAVSDILDQATFSKGFDPEFSKACLNYEATGQLSPAIIGRIKSEYGIKIVK